MMEIIKRLNRKFWNWLILDLGIHDLRCKQNATQQHCDVLENRIQLIEKLVKVGTDVHVRGDSWIVMCIAGKPEYVEFFRLPKDELRYIQQLFKEMQKRYGDIRVDMPPCAKDILKL
jgi:hypothetical protein